MKKLLSKETIKNYIFGIDEDPFNDYARASFKELCPKEDFEKYSRFITRHKLTNLVSKNLCNAMDGLIVYGAIHSNSPDIAYFWGSFTEIVRFAIHQTYNDDKKYLKTILESWRSGLKHQTLDQIKNAFDEKEYWQNYESYEDYKEEQDSADWWKF